MATRVLMVEDDPYMQRMYTVAFSQAGINVDMLSDGTIVYETVLLNKPDAILLDVMMPNFNGLEALHELKTKISTSSIPIIMLSAYDDDEVVQKALGLGASHFLSKSKHEPQQVIDIIQKMVGEPHL